MLFTFADVVQPTAIVIVMAGMVITAIITLTTAVIAYLSGKDKLRFDSETTQLRRDMEECKAARAEYADKLNQIQTQAEKAEKIAARQEGEMTAGRRETDELRQEVRELRDRLYGGGGDKPS